MSVDGSKKAVDLIKAGEITGSLAQFPGKMGPMAVDTILKVLGGELDTAKAQKTVDSGTMVYDKSNLDEANKWAF